VYGRLQDQSTDEAVTRDLGFNNQTHLALVGGYPNVTELADTSSYTKGVQVVLAVQKALPFSSFFLSTPPIIHATARAAMVTGGDYCVLSLEDTSATGLTMWGNASVDLGCGMMTNSTSLNAAAAGGSAMVNASPISAVGGIQANSNYASGTVFAPFSPAMADPFADVDPEMPSGGCSNDPNVKPNQSVTLSPGCYKSLTVKGSVTLQPGTYFIDGGSLDFNSNANITGSGVTIVLSNSNPASNATIGSIVMNGGANLNLTAPDSGNYAGILFYQDRRATSGLTAKINGNSGSTIQGALYFPKASLTYTGNTGMHTDCMQMVAKNVTFTGNAGISNTCPPGSASSSFSGAVGVRLIG
jgi:hypothetical protein